ncbi:MAG: hypothetical protein RLY21_936 [Planctomycetota bacterium]|jgi:hypothetical protein
MLTEEAKKERIGRMMALAKVYRGWTGTQLATALGREPSRAVPLTGNPKLDLIERLADALEWETGEVAESLTDPEASANDDAFDGFAFAELDELAQTAHRAGDFHEMEGVARAMRRVAETAHERAVAANRLAGVYDGFGRYPRVLRCVQEGLAEERVRPDLQLMLLVNLANAHYSLWNLHESESISSGLVERFGAAPPRGRLQCVARAFSLAIRGHSRRRALGRCGSRAEFVQMAEDAGRDLDEAERLYAELAQEYDDPQYLGLANTAKGGLIETRVAAGRLEPEEGIDAIVTNLDDAIDLAAPAAPHLLESWGWWSVFGANIAMRAGQWTEDGGPWIGSEQSDFERAIAICTNKAAEIADHLNLWPLRERAFTLEWFRRQRVGHSPSDEGLTWTLDAEDVRVLVGTMGRFPLFRPTGWAILERAVVTEAAA